MKLTSQRRIAAQLLKVGENKVWFDPDRLDEIKEAITKADIRSLISNLAIQAKPDKGISGYRSKKIKVQKSKGRRKGKGSKKGTKKARLPKKDAWMAKVRSQRKFIKELKAKNLIKVNTYRNLYSKIKGGFFRSRKHIKMFLSEKELFNQKK
ncbi:50S ribosomal protein L19e [Candidatus Woesearchaeota archaeon]|nr:MAG: 50S ribosomal protein L19e [Candidatus Woesearchaeota archaeon]